MVLLKNTTKIFTTPFANSLIFALLLLGYRIFMALRHQRANIKRDYLYATLVADNEIQRVSQQRHFGRAGQIHWLLFKVDTRPLALQSFPI